MQQFLLMFDIGAPARVKYSTLPAHCTLLGQAILEDVYAVHRFWDVVRNDSAIMKREDSVTLMPTQRDFFGQNGNVPVQKVRRTKTLLACHLRVLHLLIEHDGHVQVPAWSGLGYQPHVTDVGGWRMHPHKRVRPESMSLVLHVQGETVVIDTVSI